MKMQNCRFSYSNYDDSLIISCKDENENVKNNFSLGNFIFSLTRRGKIVGIQVLETSEVLSDYNLKPELLNELKNVDLIIENKDGAIMMALLFSFNDKEGKITLPLMNTPIIA